MTNEVVSGENSGSKPAVVALFAGGGKAGGGSGSGEGRGGHVFGAQSRGGKPRTDAHWRKTRPQVSGQERRSPSGLAVVGDMIAKETGAGLAVMDKVIAKYPGRVHTQWSEFLRRFPIRAATGRERDAAFRTAESYDDRGHEILNDCQALNMPLRSIKDLSPKIARHLVRKWVVEDHKKPSTLQALYGCLRRWLIWIDKPNAVPRELGDLLEELGLDRSLAKRKYVATQPKTLRSKGFDFEEVYAAAEKECSIAACQLALMIAFGLRKKEAHFIIPSASDRGYELWVYRGTKGGRDRTIPIEFAEQRRVLDLAKKLAAQNPKGVLATTPMRTWEEAKEHFNYLMRKIGLTGKGRFRTTPHGLRHEFLCRDWQRVTGQLPPCEGGMPVSPELAKKAAQVVIPKAGHHCETKIASYCGSNLELSRECEANVRALYDHFQEPQLQGDLRGFGLTGLMLVGNVAGGVTCATDITLCSYEGDIFGHESALLQRLTAEIGTHCVLAARAPEHQAAPYTLEVLF